MNKIKNSKFLSISLVILGYFALMLDTLKYPGFVGKHFLIDSKLYAALAVIFIYVFNHVKKTTKLINTITLVTTLLISIVYIFFEFEESSHYSNYVLSKFHLSLAGMIYIVFFSYLLSIVISLSARTTNGKFGLSDKILSLVILIAFIVNFGITTKEVVSSITYILLNLNNKYDEKMTKKWGGFYEYMLFVKNNSPENATIIIPPQIRPWLSSGNGALDRYFLFPRNLVQTGLTIYDLDKLPKDTYIMVYKGEWCDSHDCEIWPTQTIKASELIIKKTDSFEVEKIINDFVYSPKNTEYPYGLLKI